MVHEVCGAYFVGVYVYIMCWVKVHVVLYACVCVKLITSYFPTARMAYIYSTVKPENCAGNKVWSKPM